MKAKSAYAPNPAEQAGNTIEALRNAAMDCRACPLWEHATQTVFGEGPSGAPVMLVASSPATRRILQAAHSSGPLVTF